MALIAENIVEWWRRDRLPDWDVLGHRMVVVDGLHENTVLTGQAGDERLLGVYPPWDDPVVAEETGTTLAADRDYTYGLRHRVVDAYHRTLRSEMRLVNHRTTQATNLRLTGPAYAYPPGAGQHYTVHTDLYRSKANATQLLYRLASVSGTAAADYLDQTADDDLDASDVFDLSQPDPNLFVPPCRYVRAWRGGLVLGGVAVESTGSVRIDVGALDRAYPEAGGSVRRVDRFANLFLPELGEVYQIVNLDADAGWWQLDRAAVAGAAYAYRLFREEALYVTGRLPDNLEGWQGSTDVSDELLYESGSDSPLRGLAVANGYCYLLHRRGVAVLEGQPGAYGVEWLKEGLGCVSHATISDRFSDVVFAYAGEQGVIAIAGTAVQVISRPVERLLREEVDHAYDPWTHATYDPVRRLYHLWLFARGEVAATGLRAPSLLLTYDVDTGAWYPGTLTACLSTTSEGEDGVARPYVIVPGYACELTDEATSDGPAYAGELTGGVDGAGPNYLIDQAALFPPDALHGFPVYLLDAAGTILDRQLVRDNSDQALTIYGTWAVMPADHMQYRVGWLAYRAEWADREYLPFDQMKWLESVRVFYDPDSAENRLTAELHGARRTAGQVARQQQNLADADGDGPVEQLTVWQDGALRTRAATLRLYGLTARRVAINGLTYDREYLGDE